MSRKIGIEIEYYGLDITASTKLLKDLFDGNIVHTNTSQAQVKDSDIGDIKIELDASLAHKMSDYASQNKENAIIQSLDKIGNELLRLSAVPVEIVFPPVDVETVKKLDTMISLLQKKGAQGTQDNALFAFGVHLNIETHETNVEYYRDILLSFFLLQIWLAKKTRQDYSRIISGYNKIYSHEFGVGLMDKNFKTLPDLISFYISQVPDRNYALDMYPLWVHLHQDMFDNKKQKLVKARPTFHYRLPDCKLGQEGWSFSQEYNLWLQVESLAKDKKRLQEIADSYRKNIKSLTDPLGGKWLDILKNQWGYEV